MAGGELVVSQEKLLAALQSRPVREQLRAKAERIAGRAEGLAAADEVDAEFWVEEGIRPKGRPYARVLCSNVDQEWGTSKTGRRRILGRAGEAER